MGRLFLGASLRLGDRRAQVPMVRLLIYIHYQVVPVFLTIPRDSNSCSLDFCLCHVSRRKPAPSADGFAVFAGRGTVDKEDFLLWYVLSFTNDQMILIYESGVFVVLFTASVVIFVFVAVFKKAYGMG